MSISTCRQGNTHHSTTGSCCDASIFVEIHNFLQAMIARKLLALLACCILVPVVFSDFNDGHETDFDNVDRDYATWPFLMNKADNSLVKNVIDAYRRNLDSMLAKKFNAPLDQEKYQVLKRNADIINTLLGVPRSLLYAGR